MNCILLHARMKNNEIGIRIKCVRDISKLTTRGHKWTMLSWCVRLFATRGCLIRLTQFGAYTRRRFIFIDTVKQGRTLYCDTMVYYQHRSTADVYWSSVPRATIVKCKFCGFSFSFRFKSKYMYFISKLSGISSLHCHFPC